MLLQSERAIAEVVFRRIGGTWFWGLMTAVCFILYLVASRPGPNPEVQILRNRDMVFTLLAIVGCLLVTIVSATEIPRDVATRVLLLILSKSISRYQFVVGKFVGILGVGLVFVLTGGLFAILVLLFNDLPPEKLQPQIFFMVLVRVSVVAAISLFFTTFLSEIPGIAFTIFYLALCYVIPLVAPHLKAAPMPLVAKVPATLILYVAPNMRDFSPPDTVFSDWLAGVDPQVAAELAVPKYLSLEMLTRGFSPSWGHLGEAMLYGLVYVCVLVALSVYSFHRRIIA